MAAASTRFHKSHDRLLTQQQWSSRKKRQIDYVLTENSDDLILLDADVDDYLGAGSDHRALSIRVRLKKMPQRKKHAPRRPRRGRAPAVDENGKPAQYRHALAEGLRKLERKEVDAITCAVVSSATEHQHQRPSESRTETDYEIWNLIEQRKSAHTAD